MAQEKIETKINTKGRGGGYEKTASGFRGDGKRHNLSEPANPKKNFGLYTYSVTAGTQGNLVVFLDDINPNAEDCVYEDVVLFENLEIGEDKNTIVSPEDESKGITCPIVEALREHPEIAKTQKYIKFPAYGLIFSIIDRNSYEVKYGEKKGEVAQDRKKLLFVTRKYIDGIVNDLKGGLRRAKLTSLRGSIWSVRRSLGDPASKVFTPRIGDRWDYEGVLSEEEMLNEFEPASEFFEFADVNLYCEAVNYTSVLTPLPVEDLQAVADRVVKMFGKKEAPDKRGSPEPQAPRSPRPTRTTRTGPTKIDDSGGSTASEARPEPKPGPRPARHQQRNDKFHKDRVDEPKPTGTDDGNFPPEGDEDVPF